MVTDLLLLLRPNTHNHFRYHQELRGGAARLLTRQNLVSFRSFPSPPLPPQSPGVKRIRRVLFVVHPDPDYAADLKK